MASRAITVGHSGDLGDVIYALPTIRALCGPDGDAEIVLYRGPGVREPFDLARAYGIGLLLAEQPFVRRWKFWDRPLADGDVDFDFGKWREHYVAKTDGMGNLARSQAEFFGVDPAVCDEPWLTVRNPYRHRFLVDGVATEFPVVVIRSHRYRDPDFPWTEVSAKVARRAVCVGAPSEFCELQHLYGFIGHVQTPTLSELARIIAGADLVIANQTCGYAIAEGLKKRVLFERCPTVPNVDFARAGVTHGRDEILAFLGRYEIPDDVASSRSAVVRPPAVRGVRSEVAAIEI